MDNDYMKLRDEIVRMFDEDSNYSARQIGVFMLENEATILTALSLAADAGRGDALREAVENLFHGGFVHSLILHTEGQAGQELKARCDIVLAALQGEQS